MACRHSVLWSCISVFASDFIPGQQRPGRALSTKRFNEYLTRSRETLLDIYIDIALYNVQGAFQIELLVTRRTN